MYTMKSIFIPDMGTTGNIKGLRDKYGETKEAQALWEINSMRDHDGLKHLTRLPNGVIFTNTKWKKGTA